VPRALRGASQVYAGQKREVVAFSLVPLKEDAEVLPSGLNWRVGSCRLAESVRRR